MVRVSKYFLFLSLISFLLFPACEEKPKNPVAEYGDALMDAHKKAKDTAQQEDLAALQKAVQTYQASNGKYPESMKEVEGLMGSAIDAGKYDYDPRTGVVRLKSQ